MACINVAIERMFIYDKSGRRSTSEVTRFIQFDLYGGHKFSENAVRQHALFFIGKWNKDKTDITRFNCNKNYTYRSESIDEFISNQRHDDKTWGKHGMLSPDSQAEIIVVKSLWDMFRLIGYDHKQRTFINA